MRQATTIHRQGGSLYFHAHFLTSKSKTRTTMVREVIRQEVSDTGARYLVAPATSARAAHTCMLTSQPLPHIRTIQNDRGRTLLCEWPLLSKGRKTTT